jgi:CRISPR-associated protein Csd2
MNTPIKNRYEFVYFFDVTNGNPNGDPDAGNMPRLDPTSCCGLVTDVSLKRKIRNFLSMTEEGKQGFNLFVKEKSVLNHQIALAYESESVKNALAEWEAFEKDKKDKKKKPKDKKKQPEKHYEDIAQQWMVENFFDVRMFGAVMSTGSKEDGGNEEGGEEKKSKIVKRAGQVRGPVQLAFAKSVDPVAPLEISITRMAVTNEKDLEKERTMGRKHIVPYGLYRAHGFISAHLAQKTTGFSDDDLSKLWQALEHMFEHDRSAARGEMVARHLVVFKHATALGNAPAHELFERVTVERVQGEKGSPAQAFSDYAVKLDGQAIKGFKYVENVG